MKGYNYTYMQKQIRFQIGIFSSWNGATVLFLRGMLVV